MCPIYLRSSVTRVTQVSAIECIFTGSRRSVFLTSTNCPKHVVELDLSLSLITEQLSVCRLQRGVM